MDDTFYTLILSLDGFKESRSGWQVKYLKKSNEKFTVNNLSHKGKQSPSLFDGFWRREWCGLGKFQFYILHGLGYAVSSIISHSFLETDDGSKEEFHIVEKFDNK